jgi:hypothetical protein
MSGDRRSKTSRANLGAHIPEALSSSGTTRVATVVPNEWLEEINSAANVAGVTRSAWVRGAIADVLALGSPAKAARDVAELGNDTSKELAELAERRREERALLRRHLEHFAKEIENAHELSKHKHWAEEVSKILGVLAKDMRALGEEPK